jgi:RNA ligase
MRNGVARTLDLLRSGELAARYRSLVLVQEHPAGGLAILNYTRECQFLGAWDEVTLCCRGLIVDTRTWEVAAWPFAKFFNVNERPETQLDSLPRESFAAYEKLDGSLGILFRGPDGPAVASRGSFTSDQARRGTELLRRLPGLGDVPEHLTLLFEIIYAENKSVVKYPFEGLVLLTGFDRRTGAELSWEETAAWAARLGCRTPAVYPFGSLEEVLASRAALPPDVEGYVLRFASGLRVKLKGDAYLQLHRVIWGLSEKRVLEALQTDSYPDLLREIPEEFRGEADKLAAGFHERARVIEAEVLRLYAEAPRAADRKAFALWVQAHVPRPLRGPLFQLLDGRGPNYYRLLERRPADGELPARDG